MQAVVLPLEVQIKDHKAQLQSRLDNLAKINEKTTSINEQMAHRCKAAEADLRKQRDMIEGLIARVSAHGIARADPRHGRLAHAAPGRHDHAVGDDAGRWTGLAPTAGPLGHARTEARAGRSQGARRARGPPMVSDDFLQEIAALPGAEKPSAPTCRSRR